MHSCIVYTHGDNQRRSAFVYILSTNVPSINTRKQFCSFIDLLGSISRVHYLRVKVQNPPFRSTQDKTVQKGVRINICTKAAVKCVVYAY